MRLKTCRHQPAGLGFAAGIGIGIAIGVAMGNIAVGVGIGVALAVAFEAPTRKTSSRRDQDDKPAS